MIDFSMLTQGAIDNSSILSLNRTTSNALTATTLGSLNRTAASPLMGALISSAQVAGMQSNAYGQPGFAPQPGFNTQDPMMQQPVQQAQMNGYQQPVMQPQAGGYQQPVTQPQAGGYQQPASQPQANVFQRPDPLSQTNTYQQPAAQPQTNTYQQPAPAPVTIVDKPVPALQKQVQKGQKVPLGATPLSNIKVCLGWNVTNPMCELDVSAFLLGGNGKVLGDDWFVFYGQELSPDASTKFSNLNDPNDREMIQTDFTKLNPSVEKIVYVLTINEATEKNLNFSMVKDAYIRIFDASTNTELVSYMMADYYPNVISMMLGEVYKHNGAWKFNAVGNGVAKDLAGLCELYGVQVI